MKSSIVTITANPTIDKVAHTDRLKLGFENRLHDLNYYPGGKGVNVARVLKVLGNPVLSTGFIGGSTGEHVLSLLDQEKIRHDFYIVRQNTRTNVTCINDSNKTITRILEPGPTVSAQEIKHFFEKLKMLNQKASFMVCSGSLPLGVPDSFYKRIVEQSMCPVVIDVAGKALLKACEANPFFIKPNLDEAQAVLGYAIKNKEDYKSALKAFLDYGAQHVVISLGKKGAVGTDGQSCYYVSAPEGKGVHYVGCGDVLVGAFLHKYKKDQVFDAALAFAVAAGTANLTAFPAGNIKLNQVEKLLKKVKVSDF